MSTSTIARRAASAPLISLDIKALENRDLVSIADLEPSEVVTILELAGLVKARPAEFRTALSGRQMAMFFEKPSLRTRLTFEAGMAGLGGSSIFVDQTASPLAARESLSDIAHNLERWMDVVVLRTFEHATITGMAEHAMIPVINALSDVEHPCEALADYFTLKEKFDNLRGLRLAYVGDGNNVAHSLLLTAACLGSSIIIACPPGYEPKPEIVGRALVIAARTGATIEITNDPFAAVAGADAVYTDVWASMGQEHESEQRRVIFAPYQVNESLMALAEPHAVFMHCLPAHRGEEVSAGVMDSPQSIAFDQAENRLHVQKAILLLLLGGARQFSARSAHA
ncbi:MAG: ornithine carbamoyltransferase [Terriglobales bacterium]